jgi:hypothetical protein
MKTIKVHLRSEPLTLLCWTPLCMMSPRPVTPPCRSFLDGKGCGQGNGQPRRLIPCK